MHRRSKRKLEPRSRRFLRENRSGYFLRIGQSTLGEELHDPRHAFAHGAAVQTGPGGNALLLLSNGTVVTVSENTKMKISSFVQEPFEDKRASVGDLKEEPSSSSVLVDLEVGDLVVKTKKLNKKSNSRLPVRSERRESEGPNSEWVVPHGEGLSLDVTESTISSNHAAADASHGTGRGRGLTAPTIGQPVERAGPTGYTRGRRPRANDRASRSTNDFFD